MRELSQPTQRLISRYKKWYSLQANERTGTISVDEVTSRVASFYEKMRGVIDWKEEHLLRKTAVERVLRRRMFLKKSLIKESKIAEPLIYELIRGGHFPNNNIAESKIDEVQTLIDKYTFIMENAPASKKDKNKNRLYNWLVSVAACEIEDILSPPEKEKALMKFMLEIMKERIELKGILKKMPEEEKDTHIYVAVQRALFKLDPLIIGYNLIKLWYPNWSDLTQEKLDETANNIYLIWEKIENELKHPLSEKFYNICEKYDTAYLILGDIISQAPSQTDENLKNSENLEVKIRAAYNERLQKVKVKIRRAAIYSTLSIFLTRLLIFFAVEIAFDKYIIHGFDNLTSGLNILIPSFLMFFLVLSIRPPSKRNEGLVVMEVMKIVYTRERRDVYEIKPSRPRSILSNSIIGILYLLSFIASYGLIVWGLQKINFSPLSIVIFLAFVSLISFIGVKIRQRAKELVIEGEKETFLNTFFDLFSLPIIQVGRWLSTQWTKYNALAVLFNSLLDMPFQMFIEFIEQWRSFMKEKKEKIH